jgi:hypothetical protein
MGQGKRRQAAQIRKLVQDIEQQTTIPDVVQVPLQYKDGWYRGVKRDNVELLLNEWWQRCGDRVLYLYRIDKFWIRQFWETPQGTTVKRGELILDVCPNKDAKQQWLNTVSQPDLVDLYRDQIEIVNQGENGCVAYWWFRRYLFCRKHLGLQKLPVNCWEYLPIIEVYHPDGSMEYQAFDLKDFLEQPKFFRVDPKIVLFPAPWESIVFNACITEEIVK